MNIPVSFKEKLESDPQLLGIVNSIISKFEPTINESRCTFLRNIQIMGLVT
jgi:hypothetical protein